MEEDRNLFLFASEPSWGDWSTYKIEPKCKS